MKSIDELQEMVVSEITQRLGENKLYVPKNGYYNEMLGKTSYLIAGLLGSLLKQKDAEWENNKWMDDCLIIKVTNQGKKVGIWGIMIWGVYDTTEQWTDPFYFEIELLDDGSGFKRYTFLFCDINDEAITYEEFREDRSYWNVRDRDWKYIINS